MGFSCVDFPGAGRQVAPGHMYGACLPWPSTHLQNYPAEITSTPLFLFFLDLYIKQQFMFSGHTSLI